MTTNNHELKTRDGKPVKDLTRVFALDGLAEIVAIDVKDLIIDDLGVSVSRRDGSDCVELFERLFGSELFSNELEALRHAAPLHDLHLAATRDRLRRTTDDNLRLHSRLKNLEQENSPYLPQSSNKPVERVGGCRI